MYVWQISECRACYWIIQNILNEIFRYNLILIHSFHYWQVWAETWMNSWCRVWFLELLQHFEASEWTSLTLARTEEYYVNIQGWNYNKDKKASIMLLHQQSVEINITAFLTGIASPPMMLIIIINDDPHPCALHGEMSHNIEILLFLKWWWLWRFSKKTEYWWL